MMRHRKEVSDYRDHGAIFDGDDRGTRQEELVIGAPFAPATWRSSVSPRFGHVVVLDEVSLQVAGASSSRCLARAEAARPPFCA